MAEQRPRSRSPKAAQAQGPQATLVAGLVQMMDEADVLIAMMDLEGRVLVWNRALADLTGCEARMGRPMAQWLAECGADDLADVMADVANRHQPMRCEVRLPGAVAPSAVASFSVFPTRTSDGKPAAVMAVGHDLTTLQVLQSQVLHAEKLATVGQIAAGVAHEINNPLTSIQMCVEAVVRKATMAAEGRVPNHFETVDIERLKKIQEGAERIRKFSRDLTTYARPSGREVEEVNLNDVVEHALSFCEHVLFSAKATLTRDLASGLPPVQVVRDHIMQVVTNLVSNAAQALGENGGSIAVRTFAASASGVGLAVSDDGEGIREEDRARVFEPFFTTKPAGRGTGLGLPVVRNIVLAHGGSIDFESQPGSGTTFTVTLPLGAGLALPRKTEKLSR